VRRAWLTAPLVVAALAAGCGDDDEPRIPRADAANIRAELLAAKKQLSPLRCDDLDEETFPALERHIAELPKDSDVRDTLEGGLDHLRSLVEADCADRRQQEEETSTSTEEETTTEPETTTETETTPPSTTQPETTTPPETETTPPTPTPPNNGGQGVPEGAVKPKKPKKDQG
jgi:hypothetical protein